jgi:hypothetical protein
MGCLFFINNMLMFFIKNTRRIYDGVLNNTHQRTSLTVYFLF